MKTLFNILAFLCACGLGWMLGELSTHNMHLSTGANWAWIEVFLGGLLLFGVLFHMVRE